MIGTGATRPGARSRPLTAGAVGVVAGFLSGLFGVGGGILMVPALVLMMGLPQRLAHGTSLAAIVPIAVSGTLTYALEGSIDWVAALMLALGSAIGAEIGARALHRVPARALRLGFAVLGLVTAVRLLFELPDPTGRSSLGLLVVGGLLLVGLAAGTLAGLLGVGGGVILVPAMVLLFGFDTAIAKGTSLAVIIPTSIVGTRRNLRNDNTDLRVAVIAGLAGVLAASAGARVSVGMDPQLSALLFGILLIVVTARMLLEERKRAR